MDIFRQNNFVAAVVSEKISEHFSVKTGYAGIAKICVVLAESGAEKSKI